MTSTLLLLALILSSADDLTATRVGGLQLRVPAAWKHGVEPALDGGGDTHRYDAPSEDGGFHLTVLSVAPKRPAGVCLKELLGALGEEGWARISVGAAPAAKRLKADEAPGLKPGEGPVSVLTESFVGCDGSTKWVLTLTSTAKKRDRFATVVQRVVESISYRSLK